MCLFNLLRRLIPSAPSGDGGSDRIRTVDATTAMRWLSTGQAIVVDVREPHEHRAGHIPGAILNPLSAFDPSRVPVEPGKHLVFHCQGGMRCGPAAERMMAAGFTGTVNRLRGGFAAWVGAGGAVER